MSRQHATPLLISSDGATAAPAIPLGLGVSGHGLAESDIQDLVHRFPSCLPIAEIDPLFIRPVAICRELATTAGPIDNFLVTPSGLPVLVECKLWKNPEGRREVIGQILDYSKELTKWSASDLQREASRRTGRKGNVLLDLVTEAGHGVDEITFNDALTFNLRRGRFLLLIVGDGIREGVEAIAEYLQNHAGLHFTLGLVEMPIYLAPDGSRLVVPRVLARTQTISRTVIAVPDGMVVAEDDDDVDGPLQIHSPEQNEETRRRKELRLAFWKEFLGELHLDDPEQMLPAPTTGGHVVFKLGAPGGSSWITVYRETRSNTVGLFLSSNINSPGERAAQSLASQASEIGQELKGATIDFSQERPIVQRLALRNLEDSGERERSILWLRERTNAFVNALRPRIRSALVELRDDGQ
ncbi:hypothetical protein [Rhizobium sp. S96]|uniref:hypothetical protein n=1 Tax=Rhizobium sp. S96 TaxID=3055140 RepID=UPI0025AAECC2|nr:hypothetical protein [Rhizobium sp. S96]MDM9621108.1 hypothetical protein [Rhizobium sp. S96]